MGWLLPDRDSFLSLQRAERDLALDLAEQLSDSWHIIGRISIAESMQTPREIDLLLVHPRFGIHAIEVKASHIRIVSGKWQQLDRATGQWHDLGKSPYRQVQDASFALRDRLRATSERFAHVRVSCSIAFPDAEGIEGNLPIELTEDCVLLAPDRLSLDSWVERAVNSSGHRYGFADAEFQELHDVLLPTMALQLDPVARARRQRHLVEKASMEQIRGLMSLDVNRRVVVFGAAGTGKTHLADVWARRGVMEGAATWLTCYNDPLETYLAGRTEGPYQPHVRAFLRHLHEIPELACPPIPADSTELHHYWNRLLPSHVESALREEHRIWDLIVVDEFQDFTDQWLRILESMLRPGGRLLCVADRAQDLYGRELDWTTINSTWTRAALPRNCRNTQAIGRLLQRFGGEKPATSCPEGDAPTFIVVEDQLATPSDLPSLVAERLGNDDDRHALVLTASRSLRDSFHSVTGLSRSFGRWEDRDAGKIACETIRRAKGLEARHVVLVDPLGTMKDEDLYVGLSRAQEQLTVVCTETIRRRLA